MQSAKPLQDVDVIETASEDITSDYRELNKKLDIVLEKIKNKKNRKTQIK